MNPFYFGASERPLFGIYHPARSPEARGSGVVLCHPYGWEYLRTHRAFRQLAARLSHAGFHVLRFDYFGTGDSGGYGWEATIEQWLQDVSAAMDELEDTAGLRRVSLIGLGLGATLAAQMATRRSDLDKLVLWDPIVSGSAYVDDLAGKHPRIDGAMGGSPGLEGAAGAIDLEGYPLTPRACEELARLDLLRLRDLRVGAVLTIASEHSDQYERLTRTFADQGLEAAYRFMPVAANGTEADDFVSTVLPTEIVEAIVHYFVDRANV